MILSATNKRLYIKRAQGAYYRYRFFDMGPIMDQSSYMIKSILYVLGPVNLSVYHLLVMIIDKQIHPILYVFQFTVFQSTWKVVIKTFGPVLNLLHSSFDKAFLTFQLIKWMWCFSFRNLHAIGYHVPPSVETG